MTYYLGIDPGLAGALALLSFEQGRPRVTTWPIPTVRVQVANTWRRRVDKGRLNNWFRHFAVSILHATIEDVHSSPNDGHVGAFSFGHVAGTLHMACVAHGIPIQLVSPQAWKNLFHLPADKDAARAYASRYFPKDAHQWPHKNQDGRAEAALIALWGQVHARAV